MNNPTMLYKCPGVHEIHGGKFDYIITEDVDAALADGWHLTTPEAKAAYDVGQGLIEQVAKEDPELDETAPPTRAELEQMATSLGLQFDGRTSERKLAALIHAATATSGA